MATVIRVKRKRDAEPAASMLVGRKRVKRDAKTTQGGRSDDDGAIEETVFHFAATVDSSRPLDDHMKTEVKRAIKRRPKRPAYPLHVLGGGKMKRRGDGDKADKSLDCPPVVPSVTSQNDVGGQQQPKVDVIACNSRPMTREKLAKSPSRPGDEFVYDIYYCEQSMPYWNVKDILYAQPYRGGELVLEGGGSESGDSDDSNDENNWRNDYPDEEDSDEEDRRRRIFLEEEDLERYYDCDHSAGTDDAHQIDALASYFDQAAIGDGDADPNHRGDSDDDCYDDDLLSYDCDDDVDVAAAGYDASDCDGSSNNSSDHDM